VEISVAIRDIDFNPFEKKRPDRQMRARVERLQSLDAKRGAWSAARTCQRRSRRGARKNCARAVRAERSEEASEVGLTELKRTLTFIHRASGSEQAKKELIEANLGLVVSSRKYTNADCNFAT